MKKPLKLKRYIFQYSDGKYVRDAGTDNVMSKSLFEHFSGFSTFDKKNLEERVEYYKTDDINQAKVFKSEQAIRSSNAYSWGGTIHEVNVTITLK